MKKRLVIYMTFSDKGIIDNYIVYMLMQLSNISEAIYVVSNNKFKTEEREKLSFVKKCIERDNDKYDVGAYSYIIQELYKNSEIEKYDEVVLLNDSVFGPVYDIKEMFDVMDKRADLDFWGITKRGKSDFDGGAGEYPVHIQSYFYAFRKRMLQSKAFKEYWESIVNRISDFRSAIINYEFQLTQHFSNMGFKWDTYCNCDEYECDNITYNLSPYHYYSYELIAEKRCPFLKRKLFTGEFIDRRYTDASDLKKAFLYIKNETEYDVNLIWEYILREYNIFSIMDALQMTEVIDADDECDDKAIIERFDNLLFIDVMRNHNESEIERRSNNDIVHKNLCASKKYVEKVAMLFEKEPRLGMVIPPMKTWGSSGDFLNEIEGFVCRKDLLSEEMYNSVVKEKSTENIRKLPEYFQKKGYYTKQVINSRYVATYISNIQVAYKEIIDLFPTGVNSITDIKEYIIEEKIKSFVKNDKKIYVYGAGELANKVIKISDKYCRLQGVLVSDKNSNLKKIEGYEIVQYSDLPDKKIDVIIAVGKKNSSFVLKLLKDNQVSSYLIVE